MPNFIEVDVEQGKPLAAMKNPHKISYCCGVQEDEFSVHTFKSIGNSFPSLKAIKTSSFLNLLFLVFFN